MRITGATLDSPDAVRLIKQKVFQARVKGEELRTHYLPANICDKLTDEEILFISPSYNKDYIFNRFKKNKNAISKIMDTYELDRDQFVELYNLYPEDKLHLCRSKYSLTFNTYLLQEKQEIDFIVENTLPVYLNILDPATIKYLLLKSPEVYFNDGITFGFNYEGQWLHYNYIGNPYYSDPPCRETYIKKIHELLIKDTLFVFQSVDTYKSILLHPEIQKIKINYLELENRKIAYA